LKTDPARDPDEYNPYMLAPSQVPAGEIPGSPTLQELEEHEIEYILQCYEDAAWRAIFAGLDGIEFHIAHGYLPWQFLSPFYNKRTDRWGGSYENRLRFSLQAMRRIRKRIGDRPFIGYRINSTSFWDGDLEIEDIKRIHADFEKELDIDYVSVSAGVHHSWIHTPMTFEQGWEREYTRAIKTVAKKPVLLVGRVSHPGVADELLGSGDADAILLARQMIADEQWMTKAREGRPNDIRRCVAANYCWRAVIRGSRVQCAYNPVVGRERLWGASAMHKVASPKRALVIGAGPAGLEYGASRPRAVITSWSTSARPRSVGMCVPTAPSPTGRSTGRSPPGLPNRRAATALRSRPAMQSPPKISMRCLQPSNPTMSWWDRRALSA
jgi:2,4-dienoyl-CoA reductase-like NADH-dependent reductase (Old Yellow Enzyme family)